VRYAFKGQLGYRNICDIKIFKNIVIATEDEHNPSVSFSNFSEILAEEICRKHKLDMETLVWIEHRVRRKPFGETFDLVSFQLEDNEFKAPRWDSISKEEIQCQFGIEL